jgi:excinuclease ABC subunit A
MAGARERTIELRGVRVHNLKAVDLNLPHNRLIVFTGVSGSGKSSLAFDTIYAEGQRRYIETFSPYIRQFLERVDKPDADQIGGIPPAISVSQAPARRSARATVGSVTEIHDALAILYARLGTIVCPTCGIEVESADPASVARWITALPEGARYQVAFPVDVTGQTQADVLLASLREAGFLRVLIDGEVVRLDGTEVRLPGSGSFEVVVDRLVRGGEDQGRLADSIETAFARGMGRCRVVTDGETRLFYRGRRCASCGRGFPALEPRLFRPNSATGACRACQGFGRVIDLDLARIAPDPTRSLEQGAIAPWNTAAHRHWQTDLLAWAACAGIPVDRPFKLLAEDEVRAIVEGDARFPGLRGFFEALERKAYKMHVRVFLSRWRGYRECPACRGARLQPDALAVRFGGESIAGLSARTIDESLELLEPLLEGARASASTRPFLKSVLQRLRYLARIGLGYLTLDRPARSLSTGEARRVALARALGSGLVNTLYVLDEPSLGLHAHDVERLIDSVAALRDAGNTVVVVDHQENLIHAADLLVDIGPGAGAAGGRVVFSGRPEEIVNAADSVTGAYLAGRSRVPISHTRRPASDSMVRLTGAAGNNLKVVDAAFPLRLICAVAGVSGAGKTSLVEETLYPALLKRVKREYLPALPYRELRGASGIDEVVLVDQSPISKTPRSNPVTYIKAFDEIRRAFAATHEARLRNYGPGHFSFNVEGGRCSACEGSGHQVVDMQFLPDVLIRCPLCRGRRYRPETLEVTYRGKSIADVLDLTVREAFAFFRSRPKVQHRLRPLLDVGLDYLTLGQPASTLSGGEAQRLKLAAHLGVAPANTFTDARSHVFFVLDEPSSGLHPADIARLIDCLNALADRGHSLVVVENNPHLLAAADWIIELGPEAGAGGGRIVAQGTPEEVARAETHTGRLLARRLADRLAGQGPRNCGKHRD